MERVPSGGRNAAWSEIEIQLPSSRLIEVIYQSLQPEALFPDARMRLRKGRTLSIRVEGQDLGALRAALNSLLRLVSLAVGVVKNG
jgi:tRNA threonylcarbamoyladenosine modification (KEOPS) complex  Pcc1 subunit